MREPLELDYWFINVLAGNWNIFLFFAAIVIAGLAAKLRLNNMSFGLAMLLFAILMAPYYPWLMIIAILLVGLVTFYSLSKVTR
jgi:hypothetical protein